MNNKSKDFEGVFYFLCIFIIILIVIINEKPKIGISIYTLIWLFIGILFFSVF